MWVVVVANCKYWDDGVMEVVGLFESESEAESYCIKRDALCEIFKLSDLVVRV